MTVQDFRSTYDNVRWVPFYNYDSEEVPAHGVMKFVSDTAYGPDGHPILQCEKPDTTFDRMYAVNGPTPVPAGGYGTCAVLGCGPVLVLCDASVTTPADNQQWGPSNNSWVLSPNRYGFMGFGGASDATATAKALFMPIEVTKIIGKTSGSLSLNGSVSVDVYFGNDASPADSSQNITAYDWLLDTGQSVATTMECVCHWLSGAWYLTEAKCT